MKRFYLLILYFFTIQAATAFAHPGGMHPKEQITFVKKKIRQKQQPYYRAFFQLLAHADSAFQRPIQALPDFSVPGYYRDADRHRANSKSLQTDAFNAYACALAFTLSGKEKYADRALEVLMAWANTNTGYSDADGPLVMAYSGTALIIAAELLYHYKGWKKEDQARFFGWVSNVYQKAANEIRTKKNNWADWGRFGSLLAAQLLDDRAEIAENIRLIKSDLFHKIAEDGHMPEEVRRQGNGIWYTYFSLAPITAACWVALQADGTNLFTYQEGGKSIKAALDYLLHHNQHPDQWRWFANPRTGSPDSWPGNLFEAMHGLYGEERYNSFVQEARPLSHSYHHFAWTFPTLMKPYVKYAKPYQ